MARIKRAVAAKKKRRTVMHRAKGYYGAASRTYKHAKEQVQHSLQYQYRDRRNKKREIRSLWITRINAAARLNDISYSQFMHGVEGCRHRARPPRSWLRWLTRTSSPSTSWLPSPRRLSRLNCFLHLKGALPIRKRPFLID